MKKQQLLLMLAATLIAIPVVARDFTFTHEGQTLTYTVLDEDNKTCAVGTNVSVVGDVVIPEMVSDGSDEFKVTEIGQYAFVSNKTLTAISIPNSVTSVRFRSFYDCSNLTSVVIPNSVTVIAGGAFQASGLESVVLSESLETIEPDAFRSSKLKSIRIPDSVKDIGDNAFYWCRSVSEIIIGNSVEKIGYEAFCACPANTVIIGKSINSIRKYAFAEMAPERYAYPSSISYDPINYSNAKYVLKYSPDDVVIDTNEGIVYNPDRTEIKLASTGDGDSFTIPESVSTIGEYAFAGCRLSSVNISEGVVEIKDHAFYDSQSLVNIVFPKSLKSIGEYAFYDCLRLRQSLCIPDGVTSIGRGAFNNTRPITIELPASLTYLGAGAFHNCTLLESVVSRAKTPPVCEGGWLPFYNIGSIRLENVALYVPSGSIDIYKSTAPWNKFTTISAIPIDSMSMGNIVGEVGEYIKLQPDIQPADMLDDAEVNWSSSNPEVAAVDQKGTVWFNAAGKAVVTAECQGYEFSVPFVVKEVVAKALNVFPVEAVGGIGHEFSLLALHEPENTTDKSVSWESSDPEVATVSEDGRVSLASLGTAQITARSGEHTAVCAVTDDNTVGLTEMASSGVVIDIVEGGIVVRNVAAGESIAVYTVDGKVANGAIVESDETRLNLAAGIYIVKVSPATVAKVLIK